jgi:hypothetical protein
VAEYGNNEQPTLEVMISDEKLKPVTEFGVQGKDMWKYEEVGDDAGQVPYGFPAPSDLASADEAKPKPGKEKAGNQTPQAFSWTDGAILQLLRCAEAKNLHLYKSKKVKNEKNGSTDGDSMQIPSDAFPANMAKKDRKQNLGNFWIYVFWPYLLGHPVFQLEVLTMEKARTKYQQLMRECKAAKANPQVNTSGKAERVFDRLLSKPAMAQADADNEAEAMSDQHKEEMAACEKKMGLLSNVPGFGSGGLAFASPLLSSGSSSSESPPPPSNPPPNPPAAAASALVVPGSGAPNSAPAGGKKGAKRKEKTPSPSEMSQIFGGYEEANHLEDIIDKGLEERKKARKEKEATEAKRHSELIAALGAKPAAAVTVAPMSMDEYNSESEKIKENFNLSADMKLKFQGALDNRYLVSQGAAV